jgi:flagellar biosynthesis protein FliP
VNALFDVAQQSRSGSPIDLLIALFLIGLVPLVAVSMTSFTRIIVVLSLLRTSLGVPSLPPNTILAALAMMLTCLVMRPTLSQIRSDALDPYAARRITAAQAVERSANALRSFMLKQSRPSDLATFAKMADARESEERDVPFSAVAPAFLIGELRAAFAMGFALALPFVVIDVVIAAVLMSLGMYMVSPAAISLPIKLLLFVAADGWKLVAGAIVASYR